MIAIEWDDVRLVGDLEIGASGIRTDGGLRSAVLVSLFTDRRARVDDPLPEGVDRRGWLGDAMSPVDGDRIGSRLWTLRREKQTQETLLRAKDYAREALQWLIDDGLATAIGIEAEWQALGFLGLRIEIAEATGGSVPIAVRLPVDPHGSENA